MGKRIIISLGMFPGKGGIDFEFTLDELFQDMPRTLAVWELLTNSEKDIMVKGQVRKFTTAYWREVE